MKKIISHGLIVGLLLSCITPTTQAVSLSDCKNTTAKVSNSVEATSLTKAKALASKIPFYMKQSGKYLFSTSGAKDLALAYCLGMGLTAIHELGHAFTSKLFYGTPINVVLGAMSKDRMKKYVQLGPITLGGFNPATGYARTNLHSDDPLKTAAICAAGPICGASSSLLAYKRLKKHKGLYLTKAVALYGLFNHTLGIAGITGILSPNSDVTRVIASLKAYFNGTMVQF